MTVLHFPGVGHSTEPALPPVRLREPYAVERYPSMGGAVLLIGYDGCGKPSWEFRVQEDSYSDLLFATVWTALQQAMLVPPSPKP